MTQSYIGTKQVLAWAQAGLQDKEGQPGYAVKYANGHVSWSPKDVFEADYIAIGHVGHLPPYQQTIIGELAQLRARIEASNKFIAGEIHASLDPLDQELMAQQVVCMTQLASILNSRLDRLVQKTEQ
jgi:hypothetical protein